MLQNLREHAQGWIAAVIAGILCLAFAMWGIEYYITSTRSSDVVAKVNGYKIAQDQWDVAYERARQSQTSQPTDPTFNEAYQNQLKMRVFNELVQTRVLIDAAHKSGYIISSAQVGAMLQHMPVFEMNGRFSYQLFQRILQNLSYTPEGFAEDIGNTSLLSQVERSLVESSFVLPADLNRRAALLAQKRHFGYLLISPTPTTTHSTIKQEEIDAYYNAHAKEFELPEQVKLQYVVLSSKEAHAKITLTDAELMHYYEENKAAFSIPKHGLSPFASVKPKIEKALKQQKMEQWIAEKGDELSHLTYTNPDSLKPAADALGLHIQKTEFFTRQNVKKMAAKKGILSHPKVLAAVFSDSVLKQHNNSDLIPIDGHTAVVVRIAEYKPSLTRPLSEVHADIEKRLTKQAAQKTAAALAEKIQQEIERGVSPVRVAAQYKLHWVHKNDVGRTAKDVPAPILEVAFSLPIPRSAREPIVQGKQLEDGDYAVVVLNGVVPGHSSSTNDARQDIQKQMAHDFGELDYDLYVAQQMDTAKIKLMITGKK